MSDFAKTTKSGVIYVVDRVNKALEKVENISIVALFVLMTAACFYQVICRYVLKTSAPWTEELGRYAMIWTVMIGSGWAIYADKHVKIDAIFTVIKNKHTVNILCLIINLIILAFCALFSYASFLLIPVTKASNLMSVGMNIPTYIPMLAMPIGSVLMVIHSICVCIKYFALVLHRDTEEEVVE